jgi:hypothetical protein
VLSARAVPRSYEEDNWVDPVSSVRESEEKSHWQLVKLAVESQPVTKRLGGWCGRQPGS